MKRFLLNLLIIVAVGGGVFLHYQKKQVVPIPIPTITVPQKQPPESSAQDLPKQVLLEVPFTSQAPTANWKDDRFQDGCEEAVSLIAVKWVRGQFFGGSSETEKEITDIAAWEQEHYGTYHDTSAQDTVKRLFNEYFNYDKVSVREKITVEDIKSELAQGHLVIVPADGTIIRNPNYTAPGPARHMIVIIGYDENKAEFITNDPGTRKGKGYRYKYEVLYNGIRDYPTGNHVENRGIKKNIIVVSK